jgi:hypothetical protein
MSDPQRPGRPPTETLPPGAERFWGQFSETKAGRTRVEDEPPKTQDDPGREESPHCLEWCPICRSADIVRATTSPEAIGQVQAIQNEAVGVLRSFLALYAERSGQTGEPDAGGDRNREEPDVRPRGGPEVRDISID